MSDSHDLSNVPIDNARNQIVEMLKEHYAHGHLDMTEFEEKLDIATKTQSVQELVSLVKGLPDLPVEETPVDVEGSVPLNLGRVRDSEAMFAVLGAQTRKRTWRPPRNLTVVNVMAGTDLDYRKALIPPGESEISVFCVMGGVDIIVPPGVNVEVNGFGFMGAFDDRTSGHYSEGAPTLRINGFALMGGVDIKEKAKK